MSYQVNEISLKVGWEDFSRIPYDVYRDDPHWIPPVRSELKRVLDPSANPYFEHAEIKCYVGYSDNKPVCRSVLILNHLFPAKWGKKSAFFGFFESMDDINAVKCLFERLESDCRSLGADWLEGPFNPNHYSELGILEDNFNESPKFFETYNPAYYPRLLNEAGFSELKRVHTRINRNMAETLRKLPVRTIDGQDEEKITIRKFNIWRMNRDMELMREINNNAFGDNWYFLPLGRREYGFSSKFMFLVTTPGLILFVYKDGKPAGVMQFVLNFNKILKHYNSDIKPWNLVGLLFRRKRIRELLIFTVAIKKEFQHTGVSSVMINRGMELMGKYPVVATTWISDENKAVIYISNLFGMKPYKHFVIYSKQINDK